jgi:uncharacterized membrane protein
VKGIFVSYRRSDAPDATGRIYDRLTARYQRAMVFKDVDSIPAGTAFATYIVDTIRQSAVQLAIIGPGWLNATDHVGARRLDDPADFVRGELEFALREWIPVIPVLVSGASLPAVADLPHSLRTLTERNALHIRHDPDFNVDIERLLNAVDMWMGRSRPLAPQIYPVQQAQPAPPVGSAYPSAPTYPGNWQAHPVGYVAPPAYPPQYGAPAAALPNQQAAYASYPPYAPRQPQAFVTAQSGGAQTIGGLAYFASLLSLIGLVVQILLLLFARDRFTKFHSAQALALNLMLTVISLVRFTPFVLALASYHPSQSAGASDSIDPALAAFVLVAGGITNIVWLACAVLLLIFAVAAFSGKAPRIPLIGAWALRRAGVQCGS